MVTALHRRRWTSAFLIGRGGHLWYVWFVQLCTKNLKSATVSIQNASQGVFVLGSLWLLLYRTGSAYNAGIVFGTGQHLSYWTHTRDRSRKSNVARNSPYSTQGTMCFEIFQLRNVILFICSLQKRLWIIYISVVHSQLGCGALQGKKQNQPPGMRSSSPPIGTTSNKNMFQLPQRRSCSFCTLIVL